MILLSVASLIALIFAGYSIFRDDKRVAILCLWIAQAVVGGALLGIGMEFLALTLWVTSTLSALAHLFHALLLGEFSPVETAKAVGGAVPRALAIAVVLGWAILIGAPFIEMEGPPQIGSSAVDAELGLRTWGRLLIEEHWVALIVCAVLLGAVAMGSALIARPEREGSAGVE